MIFLFYRKDCNAIEDRQYIFEEMPIPKAVIQLSIPLVISSMVTILYNLADTFLWAC